MNRNLGNNIYEEEYKSLSGGDGPIHWSTKFGKNVKLGYGVVIEPGCDIGDDVCIGHYCVIKAGVTISKGKKIDDLTVVRKSVYNW